MAVGIKESFLGAYFAVLIFSFVGLVLQSSVLVLHGSVCLFFLFRGWFGSDNYRYHAKYMEKVSIKNNVSGTRTTIPLAIKNCETLPIKTR